MPERAGQVSAGQSTTSSLTLTPLVNFKRHNELSCAVPTGKDLGCGVSTGTVTLDGKTPATATLTVNTSSTTPSGMYKIRVRGGSGTLVNTATLSLTVQ